LSGGLLGEESERSTELHSGSSPSNQRAVPSSPPTFTKVSVDTPLVAQEELCFICQKSFAGGGALVLSDPYDETNEIKVHPNCFVCHHDGGPIEGDYMIEEGFMYCEDHHVELFAPRFTGCAKCICYDSVMVAALDVVWHDKCFVCMRCEAPLSGEDGTSFEFVQHSGDVYCKNCFEENCCEKCVECGFPITSRRLEHEGHLWHEECFTCYECGVLLGRPGVQFGKIPGHGDLVFCQAHLIQFSEMTKEEIKTALSSKRMGDANNGLTTVLHDGAPTGDQYGACLSLGISYAISMQLKKIENAAWAKKLKPASFKSHDQCDLMSSPDDGGFAFAFEAFAPAVFQDLRCNAFNFSDEDYKKSISLRPLTGGSVGEGKSGSLFFMSWDKRFIVKTVESVEMPFFRKCLADYHEHLIGENAPRQKDGTTRSLLIRFAGLYSIKVECQKVVRVVVFENVFPASPPMKEQFDLKGVLGMKRLVTEEEKKAGTKVLKDRNILNRKFDIAEQLSMKIIEMIKRDAKFLHERDRIDYSLLLGIQPLASAEVKPKALDDQWPSRESHGAKSTSPGGDEVLYMGIIDILQPYTEKKRWEGIYKRGLHRSKEVTHTIVALPGDLAALALFPILGSSEAKETEKPSVGVDVAVSAAHAVDYASRFVDFLESLFKGQGGVVESQHGFLSNLNPF